MEGEQRRYYLYAPSTYDCAQGLPALFDLHGTSSGVPEEAYGLADLTDLAEREGFVVVRPRSRSSLERGQAVFRWDQNPGDLERNRRFVLALLHELSGRYHLHPDRVYLSGFSSGSNMTSQFLGSSGVFFAGLGPMGGGIWSPVTIRPLAGDRPRILAATGYKDYLFDSRTKLIEETSQAGLTEDRLFISESHAGHELYGWAFEEMWRFFDRGERPPEGSLEPGWSRDPGFSEDVSLTALTEDQAGGQLVAAADGRLWRGSLGQDSKKKGSQAPPRWCHHAMNHATSALPALALAFLAACGLTPIEALTPSPSPEAVDAGADEPTPAPDASAPIFAAPDAGTPPRPPPLDAGLPPPPPPTWARDLVGHWRSDTIGNCVLFSEWWSFDGAGGLTHTMKNDDACYEEARGITVSPGRYEIRPGQIVDLEWTTPAGYAERRRWTVGIHDSQTGSLRRLNRMTYAQAAGEPLRFHREDSRSASSPNVPFPEERVVVDIRLDGPLDTTAAQSECRLQIDIEVDITRVPESSTLEFGKESFDLPCTASALSVRPWFAIAAIGFERSMTDGSWGDYLTQQGVMGRHPAAVRDAIFRAFRPILFRPVGEPALFHDVSFAWLEETPPPPRP